MSTRRSFLGLLLLVVNAQHCYIFTDFVKGLMIKVKIPNLYSFPITSCFTVNRFLANEAKLELMTVDVSTGENGSISSGSATSIDIQFMV